VAGVDDCDHLVGKAAVVILVPNGDDDVVPLIPHLRGLDAGDERLHGGVALANVVGIYRATWADFGGAAAVHVVALVWDDEGEVRNAVAGQVDVQLVQIDHVPEAVVAVFAGLHAGEVNERIVL